MNHALPFALMTSYRAFGICLAATVLYLLAVFGRYWPSEALSIGFFLCGCLLSAAANFQHEFLFRSWGIRGKFGLAGLVQLAAAVTVVPATSVQFPYLGFCIAIYFVGVYGFHDGMRAVKSKLGFKSDLTYKVPTTHFRYNPLDSRPALYGLVVIEFLCYSIGSQIFAKSLASYLNSNETNSTEQRPLGPTVQLTESQVDTLGAGQLTDDKFTAATFDFAGLLAATFALVALAYFFTGREAFFTGWARTSYIALLSIPLFLCVLFRFSSKVHKFTALLIGSVPMTLIIFWMSLARDQLDNDFTTMRMLQFSPSFNRLLDRDTTAIVQRTKILIGHFPADEPRITRLLTEYVKADLELIASNGDGSTNAERCSRLSDLKQAVME